MQVMFNLLSNSLKFTFDGFINFSCQVLNNQSILFTVSDSGIGINEEDRECIFDKFRLGDDLKKNGTGLGLSICKKLIDQLGGNIEISSEVNQGTQVTFQLKLPQSLIYAYLRQYFGHLTLV
jgi:signal transduction histidine kinase